MRNHDSCGHRVDKQRCVIDSIIIFISATILVSSLFLTALLTLSAQVETESEGPSEEPNGPTGDVPGPTGDEEGTDEEGTDEECIDTGIDDLLNLELVMPELQDNGGLVLDLKTASFTSLDLNDFEVEVIRETESGRIEFPLDEVIEDGEKFIALEPDTHYDVQVVNGAQEQEEVYDIVYTSGCSGSVSIGETKICIMLLADLVENDDGLTMADDINGNSEELETNILRIRNLDHLTGELIPSVFFRISPNPFTLTGSLLFEDNDPCVDSSPYNGITVLEDTQESWYYIEEIDQYNNSTLRSANISTNYNNLGISPTLNFIHREQSLNNPLVERVIPDQYIISLNNSTEQDPAQIAEEMLTSGQQVLYIYREALKGFSIRILDHETDILSMLLLDPRIESIEQDKIGYLTSLTNNENNEVENSNNGQTIPTGFSRIGADISHSRLLSYDEARTNVSNPQLNTNNLDVDIAILDSGVSPTHPDLNVYRNVSFINGSAYGIDDLGHGTHVAGIAAALDNSIGTVGIAPGAKIWALKVCDRFAQCPISSQLAAIEYVTLHSDEIEVANISFENPLSTMLDDAIEKSVERGVVYVVAAGNSAVDASLFSPARSSSALTVSAISDTDGLCGGMGDRTIGGEDDSFAEFSNFGPAVDIAAPGVNIFSTYLDTEYAVDSGTSFSAPHVVGAVALDIAAFNRTSSSEIPQERILEHSITPDIIGIGSCSQNGVGYFSGDNDSVSEPLLYAGSLE